MHSQTPGSYLWIDFRREAGEAALRGVEVQFALPPADEPMPVLGVTVDDGEEQVLATDRAFGGIVRINADRALSVLRLRLIKGSVALEGFRPRYLENATLYLDTLAIPGATVQGWSNIEPETMRARLGDTAYDFVVLQYGTNEGNRRPFDAEVYTAELSQALTHLRQVFPEAQCVLIGPTDRGILTPPSGQGCARFAALLENPSGDRQHPAFGGAALPVRFLELAGSDGRAGRGVSLVVQNPAADGPGSDPSDTPRLSAECT